MRYTARARLLSFNFLSDELVYELPLVEALLLAGMVSRADNLGRFPGEPTVLLSYLFYPKPPRPDAKPEHIESLLTTLATTKPATIRWYSVRGAKYAQFENWRLHQTGIREHNRKSALPGPEDSGALSVVSGPQLAMDMGPEPGPFDVEGLVRSVAANRSMGRGVEQFDDDRIWQWVKLAGYSGDDAGDMYKFARWLWKSGVSEMDRVVDLLNENKRLHPAQPYAYFAPGSKARDMIVMRKTAEEQVAEHEAIKAEDEKRYPRKEM